MKFEKLEEPKFVRTIAHYRVMVWDYEYNLKIITITSWDNDAVSTICQRMIETGQWQGYLLHF